MVTEIRTALPVPAGTGLQLELSDGKSVTGVVRTVMDGTLTVVLSDDGPKLDDPVTAYLDDGTEVGDLTDLYSVHFFHGISNAMMMAAAAPNTM